MLKRLVWKEGDIVSIKLRSDLFTLAQMLVSPKMRFYNITNATGRWKNIDLNTVEPLFEVFVGQVIKTIIASKVKDPSVQASTLPPERLMIKPYLNLGEGPVFQGGRLIDMKTYKVGSTKAPVVKKFLHPKQDKKIIQQYELTNMWGAKDTKERLLNFFITGKKDTLLKKKIFPDNLNYKGLELM